MTYGNTLNEIDRRKAVEQVVVHNKYIGFVARDFGVEESELKKWIQESGRGDKKPAEETPWYRKRYRSAGVFSQPSRPSPVKKDKTPEPPPPEKKPVYRVRLSQGEFEKPEGGFQFNKPCGLKVRADLPADCPRKKVSFSLYSVYKGEEEDMNAGADGFVKDGFARAEIKLFYNQAFYYDSQKPDDAEVEYFFRARHADVPEPHESERLKMLCGHCLRIILADDDGIPFADTVYQFEIDGVKGELKSTTAEGMADEPMPVDARSGKLTFWPFGENEEAREYDLDIAPSKSCLRIVLEDNGDPRKDVDYQFEVDGAKKEKKKTDEKGHASEDIPAFAKDIKLFIWETGESEPVEIKLDANEAVNSDQYGSECGRMAQVFQN
ncbi:hypothetical protein ACFL5V_02850 [Fibrobacterota bacterium]